MLPRRILLNLPTTCTSSYFCLDQDSPVPRHEREDVFVLKDVVEPDALPGMGRAPPPHVREPELEADVSVDRVADHADRAPALHDHRLDEVRFLPVRLHVDADELQALVDLLLEPGEPLALDRGDRHDLPALESFLDLAEVVTADEIDLVQDDEGGDVDAVRRQHVDEFVLADVLAHDDVAAQVSELPDHVRDHLLRDLLQGHGRIDCEPAAHLLLNYDVRRSRVHADAGGMELVREHGHVRLEDVDHEEDEVAHAGDGDDLAASPAPLGGAADDARHVQDLDPRALVLHEPRDHLERGEVVRADLARRGGDRVEERGLPRRRESHEADRRVPRLLDGVADAAPLAFRRALLLLVLQPGELRLQLADVVLRVFVVLRPRELVLDRPDVLVDG